MNQNDLNNKPRMISPEEIQRVNNISQEELQQTQVINLKDVEEAVRIEKRTSKKPAIILGIVGIAFLLFGSIVQVSTSLKEKKAEEKVIEHRREEKTVKKTYLSCNQTKLNTNGIDFVYSFSYSFEDSKLVKETKILTAVPTPGNNKGVEDITKSKESLKKYINRSQGYNLALTETEKGYTLTTEIDYKEFDATKINVLQKENMATSVDYAANTLEETIKEDMLEKKFVCQ